MTSQVDYRVTLNDANTNVLHLDLQEKLSELFSLLVKGGKLMYTKLSLSKRTPIDHMDKILLLQNETVKRHLSDIVEVVKKSDSHNILHLKFDLDTFKKTREYCVQYKETDLHFIAGEALTFSFIHNKGIHKRYIVAELYKMNRQSRQYTMRNNSANKNEPSICSFHYQEQGVTACDASKRPVQTRKLPQDLCTLYCNGLLPASNYIKCQHQQWQNHLHLNNTKLARGAQFIKRAFSYQESLFISTGTG